jgi:transposase
MLHIEVRKKIMEAKENGLTVKEICRAYSVGKTAVYDLYKQERETGSIEPLTHLRGRKPILDDEQVAAIDALLKERMDITISELREELRIPMSDSGVRNIVNNKLGYQYKKRQYTQVNETDLT